MTADRLRFEAVSFRYSAASQWIFRDLSLDLARGPSQWDIVAAMGPSGSGKSTFLRLAAGVEQPASGRVLIPEGAVVAYMAQQPVIFEHLSAIENARYFALAGRHKARFDARGFELLVEQLQLRPVIDAKTPVASLSGGERQRLALLRSLSIRPTLLLLDEPCAGLDADVKWQFLAILRRAVSASGLSAIYVTHHADEALAVADGVLFMEPSTQFGRTEILQGSITDMAHEPPTLTMADAFSPLPLNKVGLVSDVAAGCYRLSTSISSADRLLVFAPHALQRVDEGGEFVEVVASNAVYWYGTLVRSGVTLVGMQAGAPVPTGMVRASLGEGLVLYDAVSHRRVGNATLCIEGGEGWTLRTHT